MLAILRYVGFYDEAVLQETESLLLQGGLSESLFLHQVVQLALALLQSGQSRPLQQQDYLAAKRMELSEEAYVAFTSEHGEWYPGTLQTP